MSDLSLKVISTLLGVAGRDGVDPERERENPDRVVVVVCGVSNMQVDMADGELDEAGDSNPHVAPQDEYSVHWSYDDWSAPDWLANMISEVVSLLQ